MDEETDFLAWSEHKADAILQKYRSKLPHKLDDQNDNVVALVCLDGAFAHKKRHEDLPGHYADFSSNCRRIFAEHNGVVGPDHLCESIDYVVCGWFPYDGQDSIRALAA